MANYTVTHSCGHQHAHQLVGKHSDRDRKLEWLATTVCGDCYKKQRDADGPEVYLRPVEMENGIVGVEFIAINSFSVKDTLKERGWAYQADAFFVGPQSNDLFKAMFSAGKSGWHKILAPATAEAELEWIEDQGWHTYQEGGHPIAQFMMSIAEGRPDIKVDAAIRQREQMALKAPPATETTPQAPAATDKEAEEAAKQAKIWRAKKRCALMVRESLGDGWTITVWVKDGERRVYLDKGRSKIAYYVTGNRRNAPETLDMTASPLSRADDEARKPEIALACSLIAKTWVGAVRIEQDKALAFAEEVAIPATFAEAIAQRK